MSQLRACRFLGEVGGVLLAPVERDALFLHEAERLLDALAA